MTFTKQMKADLTNKMKDDMSDVFSRIVSLARMEGATSEDVAEITIYAAVAGLSASSAGIEAHRGEFTETDLENLITVLLDIARLSHGFYAGPHEDEK